jgi:transcriptional regulator with GAF, ATPase, and Fis domain
VGEGLDAKRFDGEALELLKAYPWPGNVRELENVVRRVMALYPQDVITREIIDNELRIESPEPTSPQGSTSMGPATIAQSVEENMRRYFAGFGEDLPPSGLYQRVFRGGGISPDTRCADRDAGQPDQGRRSARAQPQHAAQENPRTRRHGLPLTASGLNFPIATGTA